MGYDFPEVETVAVVIAAWNGANYIQATLDSVFQQNRPVDEVIVVDDGSQDNTAALVQLYPKVTLIRQENAGRCAARNVGIMSATADAIIILDQDDIMLPNNVEVGVQMLNENKQVAFSGGVSAGIDDLGMRRGNLLGSSEPCTYKSMLRGRMFVPPSVIMFRREPLRSIGGFDTNFKRGGEDSDLYLRIAQTWPVHSHEHVVVEYRRHGDNGSNDSEAMLTTSLQFLDKQRDFIAAHPEYLEDWKIGKRHWCALFGKNMVMQAVSVAKRRNLGRAGKILYLALRYYPKSYAIFVRYHLAKRGWRTPE